MNINNLHDAERFFRENFRRPSDEELRQTGHRKVSLSVFFTYHDLQTAQFAEVRGHEHLDFVAVENGLATQTTAMNQGYFFAKAASLLREAGSGEKAKNAASLLNEVVKAHDISAFFIGTYVSDYSAAMLNSKLPRVLLERWNPQEAFAYRNLESRALSYQDNALGRFVSGRAGEALEALSKGLTMGIIVRKARDIEMARNAANLDGLVNAAYLGLPDVETVRGIAFIGADHYNLFRHIQAVQGKGNVTVVRHEGSLDLAHSELPSDRISRAVYEEVEVSPDIGLAFEQAANLKSAYDALRTDLLMNLVMELVLITLPQNRSGISHRQQAAHRIASQLSPEELGLLSQSLGRNGRFNYIKLGHAKPNSRPFVTLRGAVNDFLSSRGYATIPSTPEETSTLGAIQK